MCCCSPTERDMEAWRDSLFSGHADRDVIVRTLGNKIIADAGNFTTITQPVLIDGEVVYGITSYGNDDVLWVHDDDEYPLPEEKDDGDELNQSDVLPPGFRKALALEMSIHKKNVKKFGLEKVDPSTSRYYPSNPSAVYQGIKREERIAQARSGVGKTDRVGFFDLISRYLDEALRFYKRNVWMAGFSAIFIMSSSIFVFFHGYEAASRFMAAILVLLGIVIFLRLGCTKRDLCDVEDFFSCLFHVFLMDLHQYNAENEHYTMRMGRKGMVLLYRLLLAGVFFGSGFVLTALSYRMPTAELGLHPIMTLAYLVVSVAVNIAASACLERRYELIYGDED